MVKAKIRNRLSYNKKEKTNKRIKWDLDKLKDISHRNQYQQVLDSKLTEITYNENAIVDEQWKVIKETVMEVAKQTVGEKIGKRNEEWFDEECREVIKQKNTDRLQMLQKKTRLASEKYKESRKKATKIIRNKKKAYIKKEIETIETLNNQNENRKFYQAVKKINNGFQSRLVICKEKMVMLLEIMRIYLTDG